RTPQPLRLHTAPPRRSSDLVPTTYEELKDMAPKLRAAGLEPVLMGAQDDWVIQSTFFSMILGRLAGDEFTDQILAGQAKFTDERSEEHTSELQSRENLVCRL